MIAAIAVHAHTVIHVHPVVATIVVAHLHPAIAVAARHGTRLLIRQLVAWFAAVLPRKPSVSVITPTWERRSLLTRRCIPSVLGQTYRGPVSHIIVSDGPDEGLASVDGVKFLPAHIPEQNRGLSARRHGTDLADSDVIAYLDDDNAWRPDHLDRLVSALVKSGADFAYSRALCHDSGRTWTIGQSAPVFGQIDTSLIVHRSGLLGLAGWEPSAGPADWSLVSRWVAGGAMWAHVPHVTMDYYHPAGADHGHAAV